MNYFHIIIVTLGAIILFPLHSFSNDEIIFESLIIKGFHKGLLSGPDPSLLSKANALNLEVSSQYYAPFYNNHVVLNDILSRVYNVPYGVKLAGTEMTWNGEKSSLEEVFIYNYAAYAISMKPEVIDSDTAEFTIIIKKYSFDRYHNIYETEKEKRFKVSGGSFYLFPFVSLSDYPGGTEWLNHKLKVFFNNPIIVSLPCADRSLFLSIRVRKRNDSRMAVKIVGERLLSFSVGQIDPVCHKHVGKGDGYGESQEPRALMEYEGKSYLFCSDGCMNIFKKNPELYIKNVFESGKELNKYGAIFKTPPVDWSKLRFLWPKVIVVPMDIDRTVINEGNKCFLYDIEVDEKGRVKAVSHIISKLRNDDDPFIGDIRQWLFVPSERSVLNKTSQILKVTINEGREIAASESDNKKMSTLKKSDLSRLMLYSKKLENMVFNSYCKERLIENIFQSRYLGIGKSRILLNSPSHGLASGYYLPAENNVFDYDYQVIKINGISKGRRIPLGSTPPFDSDIKKFPYSRRFVVDKAAFGPVGIFGSDAQRLYDYRIGNSGEYAGRPVDVILITEKDSDPADGPIGRAWVDKNDYSVLKINVRYRYFDGRFNIQADYENRGIRPDISLSIEYGEKIGEVFLPTKIDLIENYVDPKKGTVNVSKMNIRYMDYKIFSVSTSEEIKKT